MFKVNVFEAKARFSEYLDRAAGGERIVICRHNKPVAELRAVEAGRTEPRPIGPLPGRPTFEVPATFLEPLPDEELDLWDTVTPTDPLAAGWVGGTGRDASRVAEKPPPPVQRTRRRVRRRS